MKNNRQIFGESGRNSCLRKCQSKLHFKIKIVFIKPLLKSWNVDPKHVLKLLF
jgi:hypothetical protein